MIVETLQELSPDIVRQIRQLLGRRGRSGGASSEQDPAWLSILQEALGHRPYVLLARSGAEVLCGYLPLALVASRLFGRFLVSLPYVNQAGVAAEDEETAAALIREACGLAEKLDADYLELRHGQAVEHPLLNARRDEKVRMILNLPGSAEELWKALDPKVRNQIRKGEKSGLSIRWGGMELLDAFYGVFAHNMRDLGTPVYPRKLFEAILQRLEGYAELAVVELTAERRPVAGALLVHDPEWLGAPRYTAVPSASSLRRYNATNANMWMYHHLLVRAIEKGSQYFDFGRSSVDSGTYRFKKQWGAQPEATVWQYHVRRGSMDAVRPDNPRYRWRVELWKRLPVWLTRLAGPWIVRGIP